MIRTFVGYDMTSDEALNPKSPVDCKPDRPDLP